jgi:hypothetical protein
MKYLEFWIWKLTMTMIMYVGYVNATMRVGLAWIKLQFTMASMKLMVFRIKAWYINRKIDFWIWQRSRATGIPEKKLRDHMKGW